MYIRVKAFPKSKKESLNQSSQGRFEIRIKEKAERNMANQRIIEILAEHFGVDEKDVRIVNGHHHQSKLISIRDIK